MDGDVNVFQRAPGGLHCSISQGRHGRRQERGKIASMAKDSENKRERLHSGTAISSRGMGRVRARVVCT